MMERYVGKHFNMHPEPVQGRIKSYFSAERTQDEALSFFGYGQAAMAEIGALIDDHTLIRREERFMNVDGTPQICVRYRIRKDMQRPNGSAAAPRPAPKAIASELTYKILRTVGTFRPGAMIDADDVRFASKCDGLDLSNVDSRQLTAVLKQRCTPSTDPEAHRTKWIRAW